MQLEQAVSARMFTLETVKTACLDGHLACATIQQILWVLILVSLLLTFRALFSRSWQTMWAAAACSLAFCLIAIWSIGAILFLLTCLQLAAALAFREEANLQDALLFLLAGGLVYVFIVVGLAILRLQTAWLLAFPFVFLIGTLALKPRFPAHRG